MKQLTNNKKLLIKNIFCLFILVVEISISTSCLAQYNTNDAVFLQKLVDQSDPAAMQQLATMYYYGYGVEPDQQKFKQLCDKSLNIYKQQAEQNDPKALYELGTMYNGKAYCIPSDEKKAFQYYQRAADLGSPQAQQELAEKDASEYKNIHGQDAISKPCQKTINTYENLANKNDVEAQYEIGKIYLGSPCMSRNELKAFTWFKKAAENGHANAQYELSRLYGSGVYISKQNQKAYQDHDKALEWLKKAADSGNDYAEYRFGRWYLFGKSINTSFAQNIPLGMHYLEKAALHNSHTAQYKLGYIYKDGQQSVPKDLKKSKYYFELACFNYYVPARPCRER